MVKSAMGKTQLIQLILNVTNIIGGRKKNFANSVASMLVMATKEMCAVMVTLFGKAEVENATVCICKMICNGDIV